MTTSAGLVCAITSQMPACSSRSRSSSVPLGARHDDAGLDEAHAPVAPLDRAVSGGAQRGIDAENAQRVAYLRERYGGARSVDGDA